MKLNDALVAAAKKYGYPYKIGMNGIFHLHAKPPRNFRKKNLNNPIPSNAASELGGRPMSEREIPNL